MRAGIRAMRLAPAARRRRGLNLTPMIDVVFLLLVFFMLVSRFGQLDGVPLALAGGAAPGWSGAPRLVDVRPDGLSLNGTPRVSPRRRGLKPMAGTSAASRTWARNASSAMRATTLSGWLLLPR